MKTHIEEKAEYELKAFALGLCLFVGGVVSGFLVAYGICRWGW